MENPWKTLSSELKYNNPWIEVTEHKVINPTGGPGIYGTVRFHNVAVGIIPIDNEEYTWLVGQYRYPLESYSWEIPEGGSPKNDDPLVSAKRELREETGITANHWEPLLEMHLSNSATDERSITYVARELELGLACPEPTEQLKLKRIPVKEAIQMALDGEITDALSVASLLKLMICS